MSAFDDATDPELGAACNRLAAWVESLPAGVVVDTGSGLTEWDLALILRHLHATRRDNLVEMATGQGAARQSGRSSVPITARDKP